MTLDAFITKQGSQEAAASAIGVSFTTVSRWKNGHTRPKGLVARRLTELGISLK